MANRICSVQGCGKKHYGKGYCANHYALWRRNGRPEKAKARGTCSVTGCDEFRYGHALCVAHWRAQRSREVCSIDGCESFAEARGWCSKHYNRWKRHADPLYERARSMCSVDGCGDPAKALGLCLKHYHRLRRRGDPLFEFEYVPKVATPCDVAGCDQDASCRGWCAAHYGRWRNHGSPTARYPWEVVDGCRICPRCKRDTPLAEWVGPYCEECAREYRHAKSAERRARMRQVTIGPSFQRLEVFDRDGWVCHLCELPIDPTAKYPDPLSASVDHVIPLIRGGAHSFENVAASHLVCNLRKYSTVSA